MKKTETKDPTLERMLRSIAEDPLRPETPPEVVDDELRAAGGDPERIRAEGAAFAKQLLEKRRAILKDRTREDLARRRAAAARAPHIPRDSRDDLLAMLAAVQKNPRYAGRVTAMFRKRNLGDATNEELAVLLEEIEAARLLDDKDDEDPN
jgi:hypothetical protein